MKLSGIIYLQLKISDFVKKPFSFDLLNARIKKILSYFHPISEEKTIAKPEKVIKNINVENKKKIEDKKQNKPLN